MNTPDAPVANEGFFVARDPDSYLIEVGQYTQMALDHFKKYAHSIFPRHTLQDQFKSDGRYSKLKIYGNEIS